VLTSFTAPVGDDCDLHVLREAQDFGDETSDTQECSAFRAHQKDLCDSFTVRELHEGGSGISSFEYSRFDMEVPGEIQMPFNGLSFEVRQAAQIAGFGNVDRETFGPKIIRDASPPADKHGRRRFAGDMNEEPIVGSWSLMPKLHLMGGLAKRQFTQADQRLFAEEIP
jgi:hypothetical protein